MRTLETRVANPQWNPDAARHAWAVPHWSQGYFDVGDDGNLVVRPRREQGPALALPALVDAAQASGARLPLLLRFADILHDRRERLQRAFAQAIRDWDYGGRYTLIYPIKVNQQNNVAGALAATFETASRGLVFEHQATTPAGRRMAGELRGILQQAGRGGGSRFETEVADVLRAIERGATRPGEHPRAYLDLVARILGDTAGPARPDEPRIVLP